MKMHSVKFKDPLISRAQPVTLLVPVIEESLKTAGIAPNREQILDLFMRAQPRIAVVHGGEDHPPNMGMKETIRRVVRHIWWQGGLPFEVSQNVPCEELAHGTAGAHYTLLSRNFCTANLAAHMEAHSYDGAVLIGSCDKMMVGDLRAVIEADLVRQRRKARPVFAMVIPSIVPREVFAPEDDRRRFEPLKSRLSDPDRNELDELLQRPLKPNVYADIKCFLDRCFHRRLILDGEKDDLEHAMAACTSVYGASCAASDASMVHRIILASFGMVPRRLDIALKAPSDEQISDAVKRLVDLIQRRERRFSAASLARNNLDNAAAVWSATGGHPGWLLHLSYLADGMGRKLTLADLTAQARKVPQILGVGEAAGASVYTMAVENENGGNSGIDTVMRTLSEKRFIEDRSLTLDGSWAQRIIDARSANGNFLHSTTTPFAPSCGLTSVQGNLCSGGVMRIGRGHRAALDQFDKKVYLAVYYLGLREFQADLASRGGILDRVKRRVTRDDLYGTWLLNWNDGASADDASLPVDRRNKLRLWDHLLERRLLRIMIVVAGVGPHAAGMPEVRLSGESAALLRQIGVLVTDGRVSYGHDGISIAHIVPEAMDGGGLGAIRTGDWIYLDVEKGQLQAVAPSNGRSGYKAIAAKDLLNRTDRRRRVHELEKRRMELLPSFRVLLDQLSTAEAGISPFSRA